MKKQSAPFLQTGLFAVYFFLTLHLSAQNKQGNLKAAATKISITPGINDLPKGFKSIRDRIYVRVIMLDNGISKALLITVDGDDAFGRYTFQVLNSVLKEGCAQESIVNGLIGLIGRINPSK